MCLLFYCLVILFMCNICEINCKYVEGHLKTVEDWAFVARFCFLSQHGQYEYLIEFEKRFGEPQLLLYYDDKTQWPAVYKTQKTCLQKVSVLSPHDNQAVTLSARVPYNILSGCTLKSAFDTAGDATRTTKTPNIPTTSTEKTTNDNNDPTYYDQFLKQSTTTPMSTNNNSNITDNYDGNNLLINNETDVFNVTAFNDYKPYTGLYANKKKIRNENYNDVEELFNNNNNNKTRLPRSTIPLPVKDNKNTLIVSCRNIGGFKSARERWWYIAIANCGSEKGLDVKYKFRMVNGPPGDVWHEHFSADEIYIPPILLTECIAYAFLLLAVFLCAIELKTRHLFHCTYRLFTFSAVIQWFGTLFQGVAWTKYAVTGIGPQTTLGGLLMGASEISFLTLLLLMAKGFTITRARLSSCSIVKLTVFINIYIVTYISLYIYQAEAFDPGEVLNIYESPAGFGLAGMRIAAWIAFIFSTATTLRKNPEKTVFYYPFGLLGSLWILGGPLLTFVGVGFLDAWVRESVMCGTTGAMAFGGHAAFLWLTWPSRANKSFPYHVRTNHVGIAAEDDDGADYPRHPYEPTIADPNVIIPLSRRTEELLNGVYNQYTMERDVYNSNSTPHSHVTFPQPTRPYNLNDIINNDTNNSQIIQNNFVDDPIKPIEKTDVRTPINNENNFINEIDNDNQNDSGHPSIDAVISPDGTEISSSIDTNKNINVTSAAAAVTQNSTNIVEKKLKVNPFLINGQQRIPNKVILEPIEHPIKMANDVPKHLFAAKGPTAASTT